MVVRTYWIVCVFIIIDSNITPDGQHLYFFIINYLCYYLFWNWKKVKKYGVEKSTHGILNNITEHFYIDFLLNCNSWNKFTHLYLKIALKIKFVKRFDSSAFISVLRHVGCRFPCQMLVSIYLLTVYFIKIEIDKWNM